MRRISREGLARRLLRQKVFGWPIEGLWRRGGWIVENTTPRKILHGGLATQAYLRKSETVPSIPPVVKIDISPLCNLKCTICVHARPNGNPDLERQRFAPSHKMTVEQFRRIIDELEGKASAVSLYLVGDPIVHPHLDEICRTARDAGLNVHVSTNFSTKVSDARIRSIVQSGVTHLRVCVDGLSQEKYQLTRVGGRIDRVVHNLERACRVRRELAARYPHVEVQYIKYQHNVDELDEARRRFQQLGVDQMTDFWGTLHNYTDANPGKYAVYGPKKSARTPRCPWPYFSTVILWNGDVIPCCRHRLGLQYTDDDARRTLGNVFETSLEEVWNSPAYRAVRRLASNPERIRTEAELESSFCNGCPTIFRTEWDSLARTGEHYRWEEFFELDERGLPRRRHLPVAATGAKTATAASPAQATK